MDDVWTCPDDGHTMSTFDDYEQHCKDVHDGVPVTMDHNRSRCAACGLPGHRYGTNDGRDRHDPQACINTLLGVVDELLEAIRLTQEHAQFPCLPGWSWWDAYRKHRPEDAARLEREWLAYFEPDADVGALTVKPRTARDEGTSDE